MDNEMLEHHGIKGMKWGVRRFQTATGALTAAGKSRYEKRAEKLKARNALLDQKLKAKAKYQQLKDENAAKKALLKGKKQDDDAEDAKKADEKGAPKKKSVSQMTNEELIAAIDRTRLENTYKQLHPEEISAGRKFLDTVGNDVVKPAAVIVGKKFLTDALTKLGEKALGVKIDPDASLSWDDKIKKQTWTKNAKDVAKDDAEREYAIAKAKNQTADEIAKANNRAKSNDSSASTNNTAKSNESSASNAKKTTADTGNVSVSATKKAESFVQKTAYDQPASTSTKASYERPIAEAKQLISDILEDK